MQMQFANTGSVTVANIHFAAKRAFTTANRFAAANIHSTVTT